MKADTLHALQYIGGKSGSAAATTGIGRWVAGLLPTEGVELYAEPYAGMLGVLLQRPKAASEIGNDLNRVVVNWWKVVADPELYPLLSARLTASPFASEELFGNAAEYLTRWEYTGEPDLDCAYWWTIRTCMTTSLRPGKATFSVTLTAARNYFPDEQRLRNLYNRIRRVQLTVRPAVEVVRFAGRHPKGLVYCDPPYPSTPDYYAFGNDPEELAAALRDVSGYAALSGQDGDPWDALLPGWFRSFFEARRMLGWTNNRKFVKPVTEVVWTNYNPEGVIAQRRLFG